MQQGAAVCRYLRETAENPRIIVLYSPLMKAERNKQGAGNPE
ncbi:hypothetical protein [Morganella morganii]|nr:hypothetical protein [Morganella morganii]